MNEELVPLESDAELQSFTDSVRRFVEQEIAPNVNAWDEAEGFPRELYGRAGARPLARRSSSAR